MVYQWIDELVCYGLNNQLVDAADEVYVKNRLLELFELDAYETSDFSGEVRPLHEILEDLMKFAYAKGIMEDDTITVKDLFDTKIMGILTPPPSTVQRTFAEKYVNSPVEATDYYYEFSQATNYIRKDRIAKDEKWVTETEYGPIDITINLSKPEKDPRDIAKAGKAKASGYPACLLCKENEGYAGRFDHPARQNHRIIPMTLDGDDYYLQYSPYVYYNEHCIIFNKKHTPMKIDKAVFRKLLGFVEKFPHYTAGSNADLPIVGGSILSHDHFQGGNYTFAMAKAPYEKMFSLKAWPNVNAGIVTDIGAGNHLDHLRGRNPQAGGKAGSTLENMVVLNRCVERHQAAHGGTTDDGIFAVGQGAKMGIDEGFELIHEPLHVNMALAGDLAHGSIFKIKGRIFMQTAVAHMIALNGNNNHGLSGAVHVFLHTPGFAVGCIAVIEDVVSVKHIQDGKTFFRFGKISFGQINISFARLSAGKRRDSLVPFINHSGKHPLLQFCHLIV